MTPDRETVQDLFLSFLGLEELGKRDEKDDSPLRNVLIIAAQCPYFLLFGSKFWTISCFNGMVVIVFVPFPFLLPYVSLDQPHKHTHNTMFLRIQCSVCISFYLDILDRVTSVCPAHIKIFEKKLKPEMMKLIKCAFSGVLYSVFCLLFCVGRFHVFHGLKVMEPIDSNEEILETNENKKKNFINRVAPSKNVLLLGRWEETTADGRHIRSKSLLLQRRRWNPFNSFPSGTLWWHIEHRGIEACGRIENLTFDGTLFPWINSWLRLTYPRYIIHVDMDEMIGILLCGTHSLVVANLEWTKKKTSPIFGFALRLCERTYFADTQTVERHSSLAFRTAELRVRANMWIRFSFWEGRKHANNANNRTQFIPYQMSCEHLSIPAVYITNTVFDLYSMNIAILINILEFDRKIGFAHHGLQGISLLFFLHFCIHTFCMLNVERSAKSNAALITCIRKFTQIFVWCNWPEFTWMKCVCVGTRRPNDGHV